MVDEILPQNALPTQALTVSYKRRKLKNKKGAGRPATIPKELEPIKLLARRQFENSVLGSLRKLLETQMSLAIGTTSFFELQKTRDGIVKWVRVGSPDRILDLLQNYTQGKDYLIHQIEGDNTAIDSLLDRVLGKAVNAKEDPAPPTYQFNTFINTKEIPEDAIPPRVLKKIQAKKHDTSTGTIPGVQG
jgi:hypothetical protein